MSGYMAPKIICDECEEEFDTSATSLLAARKEARAEGWKVNRKGTIQHPAKLTMRADFCKACWEWDVQP